MFCLCLTFNNFADVKSTNGRIKFDRDNDSNQEMLLNQTGLGIGITAQSNLHVAGNSIISDKLGVGGSITENTFHLKGTISISPKVSGGGTVDVSENSLVLVNTLSSDASIALPEVGQASGRIYKIKKMVTNGNLHISAGGNLIDTQLTVSLLEDMSSTIPYLSLISDGTQWWILSYKGPTLQVTGAANLLLEYKLNETSGATASDDSGNNRDATLLNGLNFSGNSIDGPESSALKISEPEELVNVDLGSSLLTTGYSWSLWVNSAIDPDDAPAYSTVNPTSDVLGMNWSSGNTTWRKTAFHQKSNGDFVHAQLTTNINANTWYHIAGTWDGSNLKVYLNGSLEATTAVTTIKAQSGNLNLSSPGSESDSTTSLDHFQLLDRALTDIEVLTLYNSGTP